MCEFNCYFFPLMQLKCYLLHPQICQILHNVCKKEGLSIPTELSKRIAEKSNRNLRRALLMCEACRVQQYVFYFACVSVISWIKQHILYAYMAKPFAVCRKILVV